MRAACAAAAAAAYGSTPCLTVSLLPPCLPAHPRPRALLLLLQATEALRITSADLLKFGVMDETIPEPLGAAHSDPMSSFPAIKAAILKNYRRCVGWPGGWWVGWVSGV